jgi:hypothetical protein
VSRDGRGVRGMQVIKAVSALRVPHPGTAHVNAANRNRGAVSILRTRLARDDVSLVWRAARAGVANRATQQQWK